MPLKLIAGSWRAALIKEKQILFRDMPCSFLIEIFLPRMHALRLAGGMLYARQLRPSEQPSNRGGDGGSVGLVGLEGLACFESETLLTSDSCSLRDSFQTPVSESLTL